MDNKYKLGIEIIKLSVSGNWNSAKLEWDLSHMYISRQKESCLCGHYPILNICVLKNNKNNNETEVGNVCVNKFMGLSSDKIFVGIKKITNDITKSVNADVVAYAFSQGKIDEWSRNFYLDIMRNRNLSPRQANKKEAINRKMISLLIKK